MLSQLRRQIAALEPRDHWRDASFRYEAAVLLALTDESEPQLILTKRAETLSSHRGEVALPGGKRDAEDASIIATALRESQEEIALDPSLVEVLGSLDPMVTRFGVKVTPVVGIVPADVQLTANPHELDCIFQVPMAFLLRDERLRTDMGTVNGHKVAVPCWQWGEHMIWGVTAVILVNFMNRVLGKDIDTGMESLALKTGGHITPADWRPLQSA